ncbi:hypothetical protein LCGC14_2321350 [marine sediment metagenome]|uniref:Uncharacterized protein n=1 Tax=marine sediment metagenome TaxID=412755 RepID=A0A0F9CIA4_9ZZZZ
MIPGLVESIIPTPPPDDRPGVFIAELADSQSIVYRGQRIEVFYAGESEDFMVAGDRVRCLFVPEMQSIYIIEKIA